MTQEEPVKFVKTDGGRVAAGFKGKATNARDCVTRAVAIASGRPYREVYDLVNELAKLERSDRGRSSARSGVKKQTVRRLMEATGGVWTTCMRIGSGCQVHLRASELPPGRLVVSVSRHVVAVIDGVIHDTYDPARAGMRCVYGYWTFPSVPVATDQKPKFPPRVIARVVAPRSQ